MVKAQLLDSTETASLEGVQRIVESTELVDLRVDEIHAGPLATLGSDLSVRLGRGVPQFALREEDHLMVRLEHILECTSSEGEDNSGVTTLSVAHVVTFEIQNDLTAEAADVSAWIQTNVYFMVYPYVRQVFTTLTASMGLPPVVLGYMRRDDWPEFEDESLEATDGTD